MTQDSINPIASKADIGGNFQFADWDGELGLDEQGLLETKRADLKTWTAQDFSNIYIRFRPHLEKHARKFLRNPSQVDEVVQDAFLYLMVTLPELDSEIGVLRFLKWKTRNLCIDVIRASGKAQLSALDSVPDIASNDSEISSGLEQAEDAAIVRLALSKLNPRHREVLIAAIYEEKTAAEIASQVGLSENATHQLIFRARAAFKKALLGDGINTEGMTAAAILSVAARKAAQDAKKLGSAALIIVAILMLSFGFTRSLVPADENNLAESPSFNEQGTEPQTSDGANTGDSNSESGAPSKSPVNSTTQIDSSNEGKVDFKEPKENVPLSREIASENELLSMLEQSGVSQTTFEKPISKVGSENQIFGIVVSDDAGLFAEFNFQLGVSEPFSDVLLIASTDTLDFVLFPKVDQFSVSTNEDDYEVYTLVGAFRENASILSEEGEKLPLKDLFEIRVEVVVNSNEGNVVTSTIELIRKSQ